MRSCRLVLGTISALFSAAPLHAEPAGRLLYDAGSSAPSCPDEASLRTAVRTRLGEDPFITTGTAPERTFALGIEARGAVLIGSVELRGNDGALEGRRIVTSRADACDELVGAMALAVSLAINPDLALESAPTTPPLPPPPEAQVPAPGPAAPLAPPPALAPRAKSSASSQFGPPKAPGSDHEPTASADEGERGNEASSKLGVSAGAFAHGSLGAGPGPGVGGSVLLRLRAGSAPGGGFRLGWSFGVEGRFDTLSQDRLETGGSVHSTVFGGVLTPCVHLSFAFGCPALLAGSISAGSTDVPRPDSDRGGYYAAGVRLGAEHTVAEHVRLEARLDIVSPLAPVRIVFDQRTVWDAGPAFALGAGAVAEIP